MANKMQINQQKILLLQNLILNQTKHYIINQTPSKKHPH